MARKQRYDAIATLMRLGFTETDATALRRISLTLHRWYEHECNGTIQRDEATGIPYWYSLATYRQIGRAPDRERGAEKRLGKIMARYPQYSHYLQTDPRGASLYILRSGDVPEGADVGAYYSRGIAVY